MASPCPASLFAALPVYACRLGLDCMPGFDRWASPRQSSRFAALHAKTGGGGSWTPVRESSTMTSTCVSPDLTSRFPSLPGAGCCSKASSG